MRVLRAGPLLWAAMAAYATAFAALSVLRQEAFETGRFDLGNMVQAVWSTAHGHALQVTNLHGAQASRLAAHFDPILVVFAPFWWIWPSPNLLLTAQALAVALGALPLFWLAHKAGQSVLAYQVTGVSNQSLFSVQPSVDNNGTLTYTVAPNVSG